jgi:hypothetical protein
VKEPNNSRKFIYDESGLHETVDQITDSYISGYVENESIQKSRETSPETFEG